MFKLYTIVCVWPFHTMPQFTLQCCSFYNFPSALSIHLKNGSLFCLYLLVDGFIAFVAEITHRTDPIGIKKLNLL